MSKEHFLIIGARGFIGSWICRLLVEEGVKVTATDIKFDPKSLNSVLEPHQIQKINKQNPGFLRPQDVIKYGSDEKHQYNYAICLVNKLYPFKDMANASTLHWQIPFPVYS